MSLKNKFLRSLLIGATALALTATVTAPAKAADGSDVILGVLGGLIIAGTIYQTRKHRSNRRYATSNARNYNYSRYNNYGSGYNQYDYERRHRNHYGHGRHNKYRQGYRY